MTLPDPAPNGATTYFTYDAPDRVTQVTNPDGTFRTTTYNCCVKLSETDENGKKTQFEYDALNRLVRIYPADGPNKTGTPITMAYYKDGQLNTVTDRKNQTTTFTYDGGHRQTKMTYANNSFEEFTYNAESQLVSKKKQDGNVMATPTTN